MKHDKKVQCGPTNPTAVDALVTDLIEVVERHNKNGVALADCLTSLYGCITGVSKQQGQSTMTISNILYRLANEARDQAIMEANR